MRKKIAISLIILFILCLTTLAVGIHTRFPIRYTEYVNQHAGQLEPTVIYAVIKAESGFRPQVSSHRGASGLMQLTAPTALEMAGRMNMTDFTPESVWEPETNIAIGSYYLNWLLNYYNGDLTLALCAYNAGLGNVNQWLRDTRYSADGETLQVIPFPETERYVQRVYFNMKVYEILLSLGKTP
jgi:soluble lytic murein transglycosylase